MGTEAALIYNLWIFSWLINLIRRVTGVVWGFSGRVLFLALETLDTYCKQVSQLRYLDPYHVWRENAEQHHALMSILLRHNNNPSCSSHDAHRCASSLHRIP